MIELLAGEDPLSSVALLKSITKMCEEEENKKGGNEESWETTFRSPALARPICCGHAVLRLRALRQISPEQPSLLLAPPALALNPQRRCLTPCPTDALFHGEHLRARHRDAVAERVTLLAVLLGQDVKLPAAIAWPSHRFLSRVSFGKGALGCRWEC